MSDAQNDDGRWQVRQENGCIGDIVGGVGWPGAVVVIAIILAFFAEDWLNDRDDGRLDDLRETTVRACAERTEGVDALADCVAVTIEATGQPT